MVQRLFRLHLFQIHTKLNSNLAGMTPFVDFIPSWDEGIAQFILGGSKTFAALDAHFAMTSSLSQSSRPAGLKVFSDRRDHGRPTARYERN